MQKRFYFTTRDLHLYSGLVISPFVLLFAISVFALVHPPGRGPSPGVIDTASVKNLSVPPNLETLSGRARVEAVRSLLDQAGVRGEIGFIQHLPRQHRLSIPVTVPGEETTFDLDIGARQATISRRAAGLSGALILLHKSPGPHLAEIRMNWFPMHVWRWLADATVYLVLFITASGIYLWTVLRSERRAGVALLIAGAISFFGVVYALVE